MTDLQFTKMSASGNDFIVIDNRRSKLEKISLSGGALAAELCERKRSVGADGLLLIEESKSADIKMRILNPDGSEVSMCGNGARCAALFAVENKITTGRELKIETRAGVLEAEVVGLSVKIKLTDPKKIRLNFSLSLGGRKFKAHYINTGVPHVAVFVKNLMRFNVEKWGAKIRRHRLFGPEGTNADFVRVINPKKIEVRTYERGVEAETLACGTGAAASAIIAGLVEGVKPHIDVLTRSGEILRVYFELTERCVRKVYLEGEASAVYEGRLTHV